MSIAPLPVPRPRVLVVDPDADTRSLYEQSFTVAGFDVAQAVDGRDALTKALVHPPNLIVMELRLPLIDGFALCEILRQDRSTTRIPILVVTAEARPVMLERILAVGVRDVWIKPVHLDLVAERASQILARSDDFNLDADNDRPRSRVGPPSSSESVPPMKRRTGVATKRRELTMTPPLVTPRLSCPSCDGVLTYHVSHTGGVNDRHPEQWDYFSCSACGAFQYRHRTRKLRHLDSSEEMWLQRQRQRISGK